jgi:hypothetical protein
LSFLKDIVQTIPPIRMKLGFYKLPQEGSGIIDFCYMPQLNKDYFTEVTPMFYTGT